MSVRQPSQPANACVESYSGAVLMRTLQLAALAVLDRRLPVFHRALLGDLVEELRAFAGFEQQVEEVDLVERDALAGKQLHAGGIRGLERAVLVGGEQRHRHVVEQVLVAARGAHQVAMEIVALHRVRNDAREHAGVDAAFLEIVLRAFAHGGEALLVVVGPGQNDDRREIGDRAQRASAPAGPARPAGRDRAAPGRTPLSAAARDAAAAVCTQSLVTLVESGILEMTLDHAGIRRVVLD